ncbi:MAG: TonB-dependent receptor [Acidobacteriota bacterium]|nr:TonB-dependent receptor [Acidobacteriota bacterium]
MIFLRAKPGRFATLCTRGLAVLLWCAIAGGVSLHAQTAGQGTITGVVQDSTGAVIPNATVTATNAATNVSTTRTSSSSGDFSVAPLPPGLYSLQVSATGFKTLRQSNLQVDALGSLGFNPILEPGAATETVEVTTAPPMLDTTNATVGLVVENSTYAALPLQMNNAQRDATAFASLAPGAQAGTRVPIVGGTGNFLGQLYIDGMPAETINQQGDNRLVSQGVDLDAVDQFQVVTSTPPAEYSGAGSLNFTVKSGGSRYHGQVSDYVRNTIFDTWGFSQKALTVPTASGGRAPAPKPAEHQNELSVTFGGHVPHTGNKLFFFVAYDRFHSRRGSNPATFTIPSTLMNQGDFTELNGGVGTGGLTGVGADNPALIFDPTSNTCAGSACTRTAFQGMKNGILTNNIIPASYLSPIATKMASFMPAPTNPAVLSNNYLGGYPSGFDNNVKNWRVDFDLSQKQRISTVGAMGAVHYLQNYNSGGTAPNTYGLLPLPYVAGTVANIFPKFFDVEDTYTISANVINQLKYSYTRFIQPQKAATDGLVQYEPVTLGITNVPSGAASTNFPGVSFGTTGAKTTTLTGWTQQGAAGSTQSVVPATFTVLDNLQWLKGKHALTFGFNFEWQQTNVAAPVGPTGLVQLPFNSNSTAQYAQDKNGNYTSTLSSGSGNSYASFLLGAVGGSPSLGLQPVSELGGRYHVASPYFSDNWKVTNKLTVDLGVRWDYYTPYHEVQNRWSFLNPGLTNGATGTPGELQFAGNYGGAGVSCGCSTPVHTYWNNWGPRVGVVYAVDEKTIFRAGVAKVFSQAGGVGGRGGAYQGTGQTGFNVSANAQSESTTGITAGPSFYLNNGAAFTAKGIANTDLLGKNFQYPAYPTATAAAQILQSGNYLDPNGKLVPAAGVSFADFYLSGRAPEFNFWNAGIERSITRDMTVAVNYVGDQSHFLSTGGDARGYWANELNPIYLAGLGGVADTTGTKPILIAPATSANVAKAQSVMAGLNIPTFFQTAANAFPGSSALTVARGLVAFPQYSGVTDLWGSNSANLSYHSLQIMLLQRMAHGVSFNVNYTYSKNIGDDGTFRSGFDIPAAALSGGGKAWHQDRIERSWTTFSAPQVLHAFGVYELPFGKNHIGGNSLLVRTLAGGWQLSGIYTYGSGTPVAVISSGCGNGSINSPGQGTCMPDVAPGATNARINGSYGTSASGVTACNIGLCSGVPAVKYIDAAQFKNPTNISPVSSSPIYLLGNSPRTRPLNLMNPGNQNFDAAVHRSFALPKDIGTIVLEADCLNVWNKTTFSGPAATFGNSNFGQIGSVANSPRDFQFAGHINF